ncbi:MAG: hypothetical protein JWP87_3293 [Labilithrix sp.]|nr:hypothetical protein [Labilithrix sp.]
MKPYLLFVLGLVSASATSCSGEKFGSTRNPPRLVVELDPASVVGAIDKPLPLAVDTPIAFRATIHAVDVNGALDTSFNRFVRVSTKPGAIQPLTNDGASGRNVELVQGTSASIEVKVSNAYGVTYIVADDLGYRPKDPLSETPPKCSNAIDDDGDGAIDFPADEGCAFANDDDEEGGTYAQGVSSPIYFELPRIADVRGLKCVTGLGCSGNGSTPYPREQILLDTGFREATNSFAFDTVVTRIASDGFYVTDLKDKPGTVRGDAGFNSVFAFNFNAPPRMRTCDRIKTYGGTANEFFGFTQMSYPTWTLEEWDPAARPCLVPEPELLSALVIQSAPDLLLRSGNFVTVDTTPDGKNKAMVTPHFGPGDVPRSPGGLFTPTADASNCDLDKNGKITFEIGNPENDCNAACTADVECTEWSNWISRSTFRITVQDGTGTRAAIQADASAAAGFDPIALKGKELRHFAGTLHFFSGGSQFTIEVRCKDDVQATLQEAPFLSDKTCTTDDQCSVKAGLAPDFKCVQLGLGAKACRKLDPEKPDVREPPPLACVFPRTFLENNPQ